MLETFLVLLAGGIMLAAAIQDPREVTLHWLRLGGILALVFSGLSLFFARWHDHVHWSWLLAPILLICGQLAAAQLARREAQRICAFAAAIASIALGALLLRDSISLWTVLACLGVASMCGLALMDMLLGHAYLTASRMTMRPFRRLNLALMVTIAAQMVCNALAVIVQQIHPLAMFWAKDGLLVGTRWFVGLLVPAAFVYMAHACIKRRATQSATGILYVAGVLIFIGEITALQLARETGLPF